MSILDNFIKNYIKTIINVINERELKYSSQVSKFLSWIAEKKRRDDILYQSHRPKMHEAIFKMPVAAYVTKNKRVLKVLIVLKKIPALYRYVR